MPGADTARQYLDPSLMDGLQARLGQEMRAARKGRGRTLSGVADKIGCSHQQWQKYEKGKDRITLYRLMRFCMEIKVGPGELLFFLGVPADLPHPLTMVDEAAFQARIQQAFFERREGLDMTSYDVGPAAGISARHYRYYEGGPFKMRPQRFFEMAAALQMTPRDASILAVRSAQDWSLLAKKPRKRYFS